MVRIGEKVKDIVEVRPSLTVGDFLADLSASVDSYHFTDITSDLMSKWIDRVAGIKPGSGDAFALAGYRGVGKSHFLAVLAGILSLPELRARLTETHIVATAQRLSRRHSPVSHVRRGSGETLLQELKTALADTTGVAVNDLSDSPDELLSYAASLGTDLPFVLLIDTVTDREDRVTRDDGAVLSEIAIAAKTHGVFLGIALDDDIAGADGMNASIVSNFSIDYLDQEHLYKIVNAYVFAKREQMRPVLHEIYESYRSTFASFRWSENRFLSLYPLHPAILEIAPFIRLYLHDFALLGFASAAGEKILGRPANSLIGLDEVFDNVESRLRNLTELTEAFSAYDQLDRKVIAQMPVMKRLEAKLVLKGLFVLSFNDESISANDLSAATLVIDSGVPRSEIEETLLKFAAELPDAIRVTDEAVGEKRFIFKLGSNDDLNSALVETEALVSDEMIQSMLRRQTAEKFSDFVVADDTANAEFECEVVWRGGIRRGRVVWPSSEASQAVENRSFDWNLFFSFDKTDQPSEKTHGNSFVWQIGTLSNEDREVLRRYYLLQTDPAIREKFRDLIPTALHVHSISVEKIWQRVFFNDAKLLTGNAELIFDDHVRSSHTLGQVITAITSEPFEQEFPNHPEFAKVLGEREAGRLIEHLFSGAHPNSPEVQDFAQTFALSLGLVEEVSGVLTPVQETDLVALPVVRDIVLDPKYEKEPLIPISELSERMRQSPYGFTLEAQHLILASIVGQRMFEFITSSGNRIDHRSLDLQMIWSDVTGIAKPSSNGYSQDRLLMWASLLTGDPDLVAMNVTSARKAVPEALIIWLREWQEASILEKFESLADERLNSRTWRVYASVKKTFGAVADAIEKLASNNSTYDRCLQEIADAFCDSESEFDYKRKGLVILEGTVADSPEWERIWDYLTGCVILDNGHLSGLRSSIISVLSAHGDAQKDRCADDWESFKSAYTAEYVRQHEAVRSGGNNRSKLDEFLAMDSWAKFSKLAAVPVFARRHMVRAQRVIREIRNLECSADVAAILESQPVCICGFEPGAVDEVNLLIARLGAIVNDGLSEFSFKLNDQRGNLSGLLDQKSFESIFSQANDVTQLSSLDIQALKNASPALAGIADVHFHGTETSFESLSDILLENELGRLQDHGPMSTP
jgi:hypothetical protein